MFAGSHYQLLFEHSPDMILSVDETGVITDINQRGIEIINRNKEDIISLSLTSFIDNREREMLEFDLPHFQLDREALLQVGEGKWIPVSIAIIPMVSEAMIAGSFVIVKVPKEDIHMREAIHLEEKEYLENQEKKLRESNALNLTLIDSLPLGILVIDKEFNIVAINRPFCKMFKINEPYNQIIGDHVEKYHQAIFKNIEMEQEKVNYILSMNQIRVDELELIEGKVLKSTYIPFFMDSELKGHLWLLEDITDQKQMEKGIIKAKEEAEKANFTKSEFLSKMSHELRTPLNGILGFSQLLELDSSLPEKQQHFVQEILKGGRHLINLINEILDLSKIETGKITIREEIVEIGTIMEECLNLISATAGIKGIQIFNRLNQTKGIIVRADQVRLRQVILNLLDNAIKYNRDCGDIVVTAEIKDQTVIVHVIDNGLGIPPEEQKKIFEPFFRREHPEIEGTGIGLALVKELIQLMGGKVGANSIVGDGSDFWFSLPIATPVIVHQTHAKGKAISLSPLKKKYKILYIEDNFANLKLVSEIIETIEEVELISAMSGNDGIEAALEHGPDLILLDLHLPDLHGFVVLEKLKSNLSTSRIPVLALSANAMKEDIEAARALGFAEYITKPIEISCFNHILSTYLATAE